MASALAERARQALGLGADDAFLPSSLEAQEATLTELDAFAGPLHAWERAVQGFHDDVRTFADACGSFLTGAPTPRRFVQPSAFEPAVEVGEAGGGGGGVSGSAPPHLAAHFDADLQAALAARAPPALAFAVERELLAPAQQWLGAHGLLRAWLPLLQARRAAYDAARRGIVHDARAAAEQQQQPQQGRHHRQDAVSVSARIVSSSSSGAGGGGGAGSSVAEVTVFSGGGPAMDKLRRDAAEAAPTIEGFESDVQAFNEGLRWAVEAAPRLRALLASTAAAVAAASNSWQAPEGLLPSLEDTTARLLSSSQGRHVMQPAAAAAAATTPAAAAASGGGGGGAAAAGPDLSALLPEYKQGVPAPTVARPTGAGVTGFLRDTLLGPEPINDRELASADEAAAQKQQREQLEAAMKEKEREEEEEEEEPMPPPPPLEHPAAPEVAPRPARSYSGEGVGRGPESRMPDVAARGLGAASRHLMASRSLSGGEAALPPFSPPLAAEQPQQERAASDPSGRELSTFVATTLPAPAAAAATTTTTTERAAASTAAADAPAAAPDEKIGGGAGTTTGAGGGGGWLGAISRAVHSGVSAAADFAAGSMGAPLAAASSTHTTTAVMGGGGGGKAAAPPPAVKAAPTASLSRLAAAPPSSFAAAAAPTPPDGADADVIGGGGGGGAGRRDQQRRPAEAVATHARKQQQGGHEEGQMHIGPEPPFAPGEAPPELGPAFHKGATPPVGGGEKE